jgi:hypothetical protein
MEKYYLKTKDKIKQENIRGNIIAQALRAKYYRYK